MLLLTLQGLATDFRPVLIKSSYSDKKVPNPSVFPKHMHDKWLWTGGNTCYIVHFEYIIISNST